MKPFEFSVISRKSGYIAVLASALTFSVSGYAQERTFALEEVIVTAEKREQSIQDVGMSIQALSTEALDNAGIKDPRQLEKLVTGFKFNTISTGSPIYTIRGVGFQIDGAAGSPTVTTYQNEVPLPYPLTTLGAKLDLERLEVLKGPQGTLYGQNSTGGLLNFITAQPTQEFEAGIKGEYGSFNTIELEGYVSGPISENLLGRFAISQRLSDGWQKSASRPGDRLAEDDFLNARLTLDWAPTDVLDVELVLGAWEDNGTGQAGQLWGSVFDLPVVDGVAPAAGRGAFVGFRPNPFIGDVTDVGDDIRIADWDAGVDYDKDNTFQFASLRVDYDINDDLQFTSITSVQEYERDELVPLDGTPFRNFQNRQQADIETFFQELRLSGSTDSLNWLVGANYGKDETYDIAFNDTFDSTAANPLGLAIPGLPQLRPGTERTLTGSFNDTAQDVETIAVYGNLEYDINESLSVLAGLRYTETERDNLSCAGPIDQTQTGFYEVLQLIARAGTGLWDPIAPGDCLLLGFGFNDTFTGLLSPADIQALAPSGTTINNANELVNSNFSSFDATLKEDNVSWRLGLNWNANDDTLVYGNVSQGYKAGGFPAAGAVTVATLFPVTEEKLLAYEVGTKTRFKDGLLDLTASLFYYDYEDKQITGSVTDPIFGILSRLVNVPESSVTGAELNLVFRPIEGLTISPSMTYLDTEIEDYVGLDSRGNARDFSGASFSLVPEVQATLDVNYRFPVTDTLTGFIGGNVYYQDDTSFENTGNGFDGYPETAVPSYTTVDLRAGVQGDNWSVALWGRNVTDELYWNFSFNLLDVLYRQTGLPRAYGVSFDYQF